MDPLIVYVFVFISVSAAVALMCLLFVRDESAVQVRLNELNQQSIIEVPRLPAPAGRSLGDTIKLAIVRLGSSFHPAGSSPTSARLRFIQAGIYAPSATSAMTAARLLLMIVPVVAGLLVVTLHGYDFRLALIGGAPAGIGGMLLPTLWLARRTKKRKATLSRSLPDFLDVMVVCLESGMSFESSLQRTTEELQEAHPQLAGELVIVQREIALGKTVETALENFAFRADLDVIKLLATNVQQSRKLGIRMAENLRTHADVLRSKRENRAEEMAQKAAVKILMPTLLFIFPAIFVVLVGPAAYQIQDTFAEQRKMQMVTESQLETQPSNATSLTRPRKFPSGVGVSHLQ